MLRIELFQELVRELNLLNNKVTVKIPGKLFITGEYAVVYGAPAIIAPVNRFAEITISENNSRGCSVVTSYPGGGENIRFTCNNGEVKFENLSDELYDKMGFFISAFTLFLKINPSCKTKLENISVIIDTKEFYAPSGIKYGFGSSAAVTTGVLKALYEYCKPGEITPLFLFEAGARAHYEAQGKTGSGGDIALSAFGNTILFTKKSKDDTRIVSVKISDNIYILPVWTGFAAYTGEMLQKIENFRLENSKLFEALLYKMKNTAGLTGDNLSAGNEKIFIENIGLYGELLKKLDKLSNAGIYSPEHLEIETIVKKQGGVYKPSGAGGGDFGLAFFLDKESINIAGKMLNSAGYDTLNTGLLL